MTEISRVSAFQIHPTTLHASRRLFIALALVLSSALTLQSSRLRADARPVARNVRKAIAPAKASQSVAPSLRAFRGRVEKIKRNAPEIVRIATSAADHIVAHPGALIDVPYHEQPSFAEEVLNRAGGLSNPLPSAERAALVTPHDISLLSVRSWDEDGAKTIALMQNARKRGWKIFLFASRAGMPREAAYDYLIENGATTGGRDEAAINAMTNIFNAWLWTCEYTAALTRAGKYPGVLSSILAAGSEEHNGKLQTSAGRPFLGETPKPVAGGVLSAIYLRRADQLLKDLNGPKAQLQINQSADVIARYLKAGKTVGVTTCTHFLMSEVFQNSKTPMKPFHVVWRSKKAFKENLQPGDLVVWFGYVGLSTLYEDYGGAMRDAKLDIIASYVPDKNPANNAPDALGIIEQNWAVPDAEVPIDFAPGQMAPISGLDQGLLFRMLEDAVAARLARTPTAPSVKP